LGEQKPDLDPTRAVVEHSWREELRLNRDAGS
jgi:hypothetical protein